MTGEHPDMAYYLSNYGSCALDQCRCAQEGVWRGLVCLHWQPLGAKSHDELIAMARQMYAKHVVDAPKPEPS